MRHPGNDSASPVHPSRKDVSLSADIEGKVTEIASVPNVATHQTTVTVVWLKKFDVVYYQHKDLLFRAN